jgi:hypothetical protein
MVLGCEHQGTIVSGNHHKKVLAYSFYGWQWAAYVLK